MSYKLRRLQTEAVRTLSDLLASTVCPISQVFSVEDFRLKFLKSELGNFSQALAHIGRRKAIGVP